MTWERMKVSEFADVSTGGTPSTANKEFWENGSIPWLNSGELNQGIITKCSNFITDSGIKSSAAKIMPPESVLIALTGATTGQVGYLTFPASANQSVTGIHPSKHHHPKYLYYYLSSIRETILNDSYGGAQKHISQGYVKNIQIPLPPLPVQRRIAEILDTADALRRKDRELLAKYDELAQSIFIDMFGDPVKNEKGWEVKSLEEIALKKGQYGSGSAAIGFKEGMPRYIRITDINSDGTLTESKMSFEDDDISKYILEEGDLLFARSGATVGKCYLHTNKNGYCGFAGYLIRFRINRIKAFPEYVFAFTRTDYYKKWVSNKQNVVAQPNINANQYGSELTIPCPPIYLQKEFLKRINILQSAKIINSFHQTDNLFNVILKKSFSGELVA